jgi:hypothetical protein
MIMGMGAHACSGWIINYENLKKICPKEVDLVEGAEEFEDWGEVCRAYEFEEENKLPDSIKKSVEDLIGKFGINTNLTLGLGFYNEDYGDRYDEVDSHEGCLFFVDGMVALTPAGEKLKDVVRQQFWTQYG